MVNFEEVKKLAELGFRLHPLVEMNKVPIVKNWPEKATTDIEILEQWRRVNPNANWGVATGKSSGFIVVDIDPKHGGDKSWIELTKKHGLPSTVVCRTGSSGLHFYFKLPKNLTISNSSGKVGSGIDIRGENGQVVIPPSIHPNGTAYTWEEGHAPWEIEMEVVPKWLKKILLIADEDAEDFKSIGAPLIRGERNDNIYHQSLRLAEIGIDKVLIFQTMRAWCDSTGNSDIPDDEIEKTIASAYETVNATKAIRNNTLQNDSDNADQLFKEHGKNIVFIPGLGWMVWEGKYWKPDLSSAAVMNLAKEVMRNYRDAALEQAKQAGDDTKLVKIAWGKVKWAIACLNRAKLQAMVDMTSILPGVRREVFEMDSSYTFGLLNFKNGTVDLKTGKLLPHNKNLYISKMIEYNYNPEASCPFWEETLSLAFDGDQQLIDYMQKALGYTLTGSTSEQAMFICWGADGNNGKSTILETVQKLLGKGYATMSDVRVVTSTEKDNHVMASLAELVGVRMVAMNEAEEGQRLSEGLVKQVTGGDHVQACRKYQAPFEFIPSFKLWMRTNEKPNIRGSSDAIWRRIKLIPFNKPIPPEKRKSRDWVDAQLEKEAEGILTWLVRGAMRWYEEGLTDVPEVTAATTAYRDESDLVRLFTAECLVESEGKSVDKQTVYRAFVAWSKEQGFRYTPSAIGFSMRLAKVLEQHERVYANRKPVWSDVTLTDQGFLYAGTFS